MGKRDVSLLGFRSFAFVLMTKGCGQDSPLLGFVPPREKGNGDEDDNRLATVADLNLSRVLVSAYAFFRFCCPVPTASSVSHCIVWVCVFALAYEKIGMGDRIVSRHGSKRSLTAHRRVRRCDLMCTIDHRAEVFILPRVRK